MAMKKKFLGLALATMVAMPATGVYAASNTQTITGNTQTITGTDTSTLTHRVPVTGSVTKSNGLAADGQITVELPTAMAFVVNEKGVFSGATYEVSNQSGCGIDISVSQFVETKSGLTLKTADDLTTGKGTLDRSNVSLVLQGSYKGTQKKVDLAKIANETTIDESERKVLNVAAGTQASMALTGMAGTAKVEAEDGVDKTGATGEFNLVFSIKKDQ